MLTDSECSMVLDNVLPNKADTTTFNMNTSLHIGVLLLNCYV